MDSTGLRAFIALCSTTAICDQRSPRSSARPAASRSTRLRRSRVADRAAGDHARRPQQPDRRVGQGGLAAAALPGQAEHLAAAQHQVGADHRVHGVVAEPVVHAQAADLEQDLGRCAGHALPGAADGPLRRPLPAPRCGDPAALRLREAGSTGVRPSTSRLGSPRPACSAAGLPGQARPAAAG